MSAPVHRDDETDDFRFYAPPHVRERATVSDPDTLNSPAANEGDDGDAEVQSTSASSDATERIVSPPEPAPELRTERPAASQTSEAPSPRMAPGVGGPNIHSPPARPAPPGAGAEAPLKFLPAESPDEWPATLRGRRPFEGDVAVKALRDRMSLDPEFVPAPPVRPRKRAVMPLLTWLTVATALVATIATVVAWMTQPTVRETAQREDRGVAPVVAPKPAGPQLASISTSIRPSARLVVEDRQAFTNEALTLGISLDGAMGGEVALLTGLASGTRLSIGTPLGTNGWRLPARDLSQTLAYAPNEFAGVMDAVIDVRSENDVLIDSRPVRLAWLPKQLEEPAREVRLDSKDAVQPQPVAIPPLASSSLGPVSRAAHCFI